MTVGFQFFGHYFLQLTPALALLAAAALVHVRPRAAVALVTANAVVAAGFLAWALWLFPRGELAHQQRLAAEVRARTAPADRVLLWGMHPEAYWFADRTPASRYLTAGFLTNFSGGRNGVRVGERYAMDGRMAVLPRASCGPTRPRWSSTTHAASRTERTGSPRCAPILTRHYEQVGTLDGAVLYVRSRS